MQEFARIEASASFLREHIGTVDAVMVLGSGFGPYTERLSIEGTIAYGAIPGFVKSTVEGHAGKVMWGSLAGRRIAVLSGRFHYYEGYSMADVVRPVRVLSLLGARTLVLTNAAGGIDADFRVGDLMIISDHLNLMGQNPLMGENIQALGERFPDMSDVYTLSLRRQAHRIAQKKSLVLREGIYAGMTGPSYETPAEVRMLRTLGASAVGMSTVPEAIAARHMGMRVMGFSCISNAAAGLGGGELAHGEIVDAAKIALEPFSQVMDELVKVFE